MRRAGDLLAGLGPCGVCRAAGLALMAVSSLVAPGARAQDLGRPEAGAPEISGAGVEISVPDLPLGTAPIVYPEQSLPLLTLNQERMFQSSDWGQGALARAEEAAATLIAENRQIEADLENEERELTEKRASMTPADFAALAREFDTKVEEFRLAQDSKSRLIARRLEVERKAFHDRTVPVLIQLLQERGAVAIIGDDALILGLSSADVTEDATLRMNARFGAETSVFPGEGLVEPPALVLDPADGEAALPASPAQP